MSKTNKKLRWYTIGNEELQAGSMQEAQRIVSRRIAFEKQQKKVSGGKNGK